MVDCGGGSVDPLTPNVPPVTPTGTRYLVVDCGGGTVDITVHEVLDSEHRRLKEVYKASGGPYGSVGEYIWEKA